MDSRRADYQDFLQEPITALIGYRDADGRPLCAEALAEPAVRATFEMRRCPYPGSRQGHDLLMNVSALRPMARNWSSIIAAIVALRAARGWGRPLTLLDVMRVVYSGGWLPLFLVFRAEGALGDGQISGALSALHKAIVDAGSTAQVMLVERLVLGGAPLAEPASAEAMFEFAEARGFFVGLQGVCAGPPAMVQELLQAVVTGARPDDAPPDILAPVGDVAALCAYTDGLLAVALAKLYWRASVHYLWADLAAVRAALPAALRTAVAEGGAAPAPTAVTADLATISRIHQEKWGLVRGATGAARERLREGLRRALRELQPEAGGLLGDGGARGPALAALVRTLARHPATAGLAAAPRRALARVLLGSAELERQARAFMAALERRLRGALGETAPPRALTAGDVARVLGATPGTRLAAALGLAYDGAAPAARQRGAAPPRRGREEAAIPGTDL